MSRPNVQRLIAHRMAQQAIPSGGGFADGLRFLSDPAAILRAAHDAKVWAEAALDAVRNAADPNPWRGADDDTIAAEVLRQIEARGPTGRRDR